MMKKSTLFTMVIFLVAILISCDKDEFTEEDALKYELTLQENEMKKEALAAEERKKADDERLADKAQAAYLDSLQAVGGIINFSVNVFDAGNGGYVDKKSGAKANAITEVDVTVSYNGFTEQQATKGGIATFRNLRIGEYSVSIDGGDAYTNCHFLVQIRPDLELDYKEVSCYTVDGIHIPLDSMYYGLKRNAAVMVPIFRMNDGASMSTIKGQVTFEGNLVDNDVETAPAISVRAMIDTEADDFMNKYFGNYLSNSSTDNGHNCSDCVRASIYKVAYGNLVAGYYQDPAQVEGDITNFTDADGNYELKVPSTADGLPIKIVIDEFVADQYLLTNKLRDEYVFGVQTMRTLWSSEMIEGNGSCPTPDGCVEPSMIPNVPAAYVEFSTPTSETHVEPSVEAEAMVRLAESGIQRVVVTNQGGCITQPMKVVVSEPECDDCDVDNESAYGITNIVDGKVKSVTLTDDGRRYNKEENLTVRFEETVEVKAKAKAKVTYSVIDFAAENANIAALALNGYMSEPTVYLNSDAGEGAVVEALTTGYIKEINVKVPGNGYVKEPTVLLQGGNPTESATAKAHMSASNPIQSILVDNGNFDENGGVDLFVTEPKVELSGNGSAKVVAQLSETGGVAKIHLEDGGLGYSAHKDSVPTVEITGDGFGASAHAVVTDNVITSIVIDEEGQGYTEAYVTISVSGDTPYIIARDAKATALVGKSIVAFNVIDNGSGYTDGTTVTVLGRGLDAGYTAVATDDVSIVYDRFIESIEVVTGGKGYQSTPKVVIVNEEGHCTDCIAASAEAVVGLQVTGVEVIAQGAGYICSDNSFALVFDAQDDCPGYTFKPTKKTEILGKGVMTVEVTNGGEGYLAPPYVCFEATSGVPTDVKFKSKVRNGQVTEIMVENNGSIDAGYCDEMDLSIKTYCTMPEGDAMIAPGAGQIEEIYITNHGNGYVLTPNVEIINVKKEGSNWVEIMGPGYGAEAHAVMADGRIQKITIDNPGRGYVMEGDISVAVQISLPNGNTPAFGIPIIEQGRIVGVSFEPLANGLYAEMITKGKGYDPTNPPSVTFYPSVPGKGHGATATATVRNGEIVEVKMINQGNGYVGKNIYARPLQDGTAALPFIKDNGVDGKHFVVGPYFGNGSYNNGGLTGQGATFMTEAGKTYVKDFFLGTGRHADQYNTASNHND